MMEIFCENSRWLLAVIFSQKAPPYIFDSILNTYPKYGTIIPSLPLPGHTKPLHEIDPWWGKNRRPILRNSRKFQRKHFIADSDLHHGSFSSKFPQFSEQLLLKIFLNDFICEKNQTVSKETLRKCNLNL